MFSRFSFLMRSTVCIYNQVLDDEFPSEVLCYLQKSLEPLPILSDSVHELLLADWSNLLPDNLPDIHHQYTALQDDSCLSPEIILLRISIPL